MSNIEEDIKYVKECLKIARVFFKSIKAETDYKEIDDVAFFIAIDNILAEQKQDKERIKELEEEIANKENKIWQLKETIQDLENECVSLHELIDEEM